MMDPHENDEGEEHLENFPELLSAKLLFREKPRVNKEAILRELRTYYPRANTPDNKELMLFVVPEIDVPMGDVSMPAQCLVFAPDPINDSIDLPPEAFEQNWQWDNATEVAGNCNHTLMVTDFMTRTLDYKTRAVLFTNFLVAVTKALEPQAIYCTAAQKLLSPNDLMVGWDTPEPIPLNAFVNVRLYAIEDSNPGEVLMDTVGLHVLGLPDFQIRFSNMSENDVAQQLWNYAFYTYEQGDVIENDNTIAGLEEDDKWLCERRVSLVLPERVVIDLQPQ